MSTINSNPQSQLTIKDPIDKEFQQGLNRFLSKIPTEQTSYNEHWKKIKDFAGFFYENTINQLPAYDDITKQPLQLTTSDGAKLPMQLYSKNGISSESAIVYFHGGGRIAGDITIVDPLVSHYVHHSGAAFLSVDYRLAPIVSGMRQIEDCFEAFPWLKDHAASYGIDPNRIAIMGDSGGGGIAAGVAIMSRNKNIQLAGQILLYPLLDDRSAPPEKQIEPYVLLSHEDIVACWTAILQNDQISDVSEIVSAGRLINFDQLAPAFISVGFYDSLRTESMNYADKLLKAGVEVEFHLYPGVPHGFDLIAPEAQVSKRAFEDTVRFIQKI